MLEVGKTRYSLGGNEWEVNNSLPDVDPGESPVCVAGSLSPSNSFSWSSEVTLSKMYNRSQELLFSKSFQLSSALEWSDSLSSSRCFGDVTQNLTVSEVLIQSGPFNLSVFLKTLVTFRDSVSFISQVFVESSNHLASSVISDTQHALVSELLAQSMQFNSSGLFETGVTFRPSMVFLSDNLNESSHYLASSVISETSHLLLSAVLAQSTALNSSALFESGVTFRVSAIFTSKIFLESFNHLASLIVSDTQFLLISEILVGSSGFGRSQFVERSVTFRYSIALRSAGFESNGIVELNPSNFFDSSPSF
jgi:hypothetical protein